jgi:MFS transporter, ACS family, solute carrier family 17 (sodium-dependent inorganic phosphate cotransporter), other
MPIDSASIPMSNVGARRWPAYYTVLLLLLLAVFLSYVDRTNISVGAIAMQAQLGWSETQKGLVLSSFFIGYLLLMLASSAMANRFGGKLVLAVAVVWWSLFTALTPPAALASLSTLVLARIGLGMGEAAVFPACINLIGRWVPPLQRSSAVALVTSAAPLSTVIALPLTGWLIKSYGWPVPFYLFGIIGIVWALLWSVTVDGGAGVAGDVLPSRSPIPWKRILTSAPVWAIVITNSCFNWSFYLLLAWLPSYLKHTFGVSLVNAGLLSASPWLASFLVANVAGAFADRMLKAGYSATFVRKLMQTLGLVLGGILLSMLPWAASITAAVILMTCAAGSFAFCFAGYAPNGFDLSPRYADVIWGLSNTVGTLPGIFGVYLTGWLVDHTGTFAAPFYVTTGVSFLGALVFLVFASGERQID